MKREGSADPFVPGEALLLPTVLAAMVLTAVNDHWLKSVAPGWLEAAAFTVLKTSPAFALRLEDAWIAVLGIQARFTPDSTDLCALLVLPLAWRTARSGGLLHDTQRSIGAVERGENRGSARKVVLLPLGLFLGGCTSFKIPGYKGRHVDYAALRPETELSAPSERGLPPPRLVRSDGVLIAFYPFRIAWLPRVDWLTPGRHEQSLDGWVWIENGGPPPNRASESGAEWFRPPRREAGRALDRTGGAEVRDPDVAPVAGARARGAPEGRFCLGEIVFPDGTIEPIEGELRSLMSVPLIREEDTLAPPGGWR